MKRIIPLFIIVCFALPHVSSAQNMSHRIRRLTARMDSAKVRRFDRNYIEVPKQPWKLMLKGNVNQSSLRMKSQGELLGTAYVAKPHLKTEPAQYVGVWVGYHGYGVGYTINVAGDKGGYFTIGSNSKSYGLNLRIHSFKNNHPSFGLHSNLIPEESKESWNNVQIADPIRVRTITADGYYLFNGKRFSQAAAHNYSVIQKRSAGSFMVGAMAYYGHINYATHSNADIVYMMQGLGRVKLYQGSIGAGYAYNWVPARGLLINVKAMPALTFVNRIKAYGYSTNIPELSEDPRFLDESISDEEWDAWFDSSKRITPVAHKSFNSGISLNFDARLSVVYNFKRYFIGAYGQFNTFRYKHNGTRGRLNDWYVNAALGVRL